MITKWQHLWPTWRARHHLRTRSVLSAIPSSFCVERWPTYRALAGGGVRNAEGHVRLAVERRPLRRAVPRYEALLRVLLRKQHLPRRRSAPILGILERLLRQRRWWFVECDDNDSNIVCRLRLQCEVDQVPSCLALGIARVFVHQELSAHGLRDLFRAHHAEEPVRCKHDREVVRRPLDDTHIRQCRYHLFLDGARPPVLAIRHFEAQVAKRTCHWQVVIPHVHIAWLQLAARLLDTRSLHIAKETRICGTSRLDVNNGVVNRDVGVAERMRASSLDEDCAAVARMSDGELVRGGKHDYTSRANIRHLLHRIGRRFCKHLGIRLQECVDERRDHVGPVRAILNVVLYAFGAILRRLGTAMPIKDPAIQVWRIWSFVELYDVSILH
mmetsp:Transcript_32554/g.69835  ORF Transcript_32554/g.69835 Transcript_32554/m.69835 type:complete len:385 (-) Transcript_32554:502-1656(-)